MMLTWKYTLPAFLVPFAFTVSPEGAGVLLQGPIIDIVRTVGTAVIGVSALAMGLGGWLFVRRQLLNVSSPSPEAYCSFTLRPPQI
ncbi:MAG: hypothetical protein Ct9H300mP25_14350 [Acidobacteriota bacterium]|nr:MAG: hypothetical protein Ct9H300mP25_14350 [Acidobacteriota bacterium]